MFGSNNRDIENTRETQRKYDRLRRINAVLSAISAATEPGFGLGVAHSLTWLVVAGVIPSMAQLPRYVGSLDHWVLAPISIAAGGGMAAFSVHVFNKARAIREANIDNSRFIVPTVQEQRSGGIEVMSKMIEAESIIEHYVPNKTWAKLLLYSLRMVPYFQVFRAVNRPFSVGTLQAFLFIVNPQFVTIATRINAFLYPMYGALGLSIYSVRRSMVKTIQAEKSNENQNVIAGYTGFSKDNINYWRILISSATAFIDGLTENCFIMLIMLDFFRVKAEDDRALYDSWLWGVSASLALFSALGGAINEILRQLRLDIYNWSYRRTFKSNEGRSRELGYPEPLVINRGEVPYKAPHETQDWLNLCGSGILSIFSVMTWNNLFNVIAISIGTDPESFLGTERWRLLWLFLLFLPYSLWVRNRLDTHNNLANLYCELQPKLLSDLGGGNLSQEQLQPIIDPRGESSSNAPSDLEPVSSPSEQGPNQTLIAPVQLELENGERTAIDISIPPADKPAQAPAQITEATRSGEAFFSAIRNFFTSQGGNNQDEAYVALGE